ncbi:MAG: hypothetical protein U0797_20385 [Gemmataceae bacterium]
MRWSVILGGVGMTLAALAGSAAAQYGYPAPYPGGYYPGPYGALPPGCPAPAMPYAPGAYPMPAYPAAPSVAPAPAPAAPRVPMPSATTPGTPAPAATRPGTATPTPTAPGTGSTSSANAPGTARSDTGAGAGAATSPGAADGAGQGSAAESRGESGSGALSSAAPSMYGDTFGGGGNRTFFLQLPQTTRIGGTFTSTSTGQPAVFTYNRSLSRPVFATPANTSVFGTPITEDFVASGPLTRARGGQVYPLAVNSQDQAATLAYAQRTLGPNGALTYVADPNVSRAVPIGATNGANVSTFYDYTTLQNVANLQLPSPSAGGLVGRQKIAEDNSPLPRDRFIFDYDFFTGVNFGPKGQGVHRFAPGYEMTFFDQWASVEVRVPFASTINSNIVADGATADGVLLGNLQVTLKSLLYRSQWLFVAGGLGLGAPTGADVGLRTEAGTQLARLVNESLIVSPYIAALVLPCEDVFLQAWYAVDFDTMGTPMEVNLGGDRLRNVGRIYDAPFQQIDGQLGAWLYRNNDEYALVRGVAGFVELHYNMTLGAGRTVSGTTFAVSDVGNFQELNLTAGLTTALGTNSTVTVGAAFPVLGGNDKSFDFQIGVRANIFFGPTARSRSLAMRTSTF